MTKAERTLHDQLRQMGCCVCRFVYGIDELDTPAVHHILDGNRRMGERYVIPLCARHHQYGTKGHPSRHSHNGGHGGKAAFEAAYGTEFELLEMCEAWLDRPYSSEGGV